jgi:hypothetical protein
MGVRARGSVGPLERCSFLYRLIDFEDWVLSEPLRWRNSKMGSQTKSGACRSEGLVAGQHVLDRLGELAGEVDLGNFGAALAAVAAP